MPITTKYFSVWQQQDGTFRFRLSKKGPCHPRYTGTAPTENEAVRLARECVSGCFCAENADRIRSGSPFLYHGKKKVEQQTECNGLLPLFS